MQESNQKAVLRKCEENLNESFEAIVTNVERYEYDSFMHGRYFSFSIKTEDSISKSLSYLFNLPENKELLEFIKIGQKVRKQNGNNKFSLTDKTEIRLFIIPYCDMIKK